MTTCPRHLSQLNHVLPCPLQTSPSNPAVLQVLGVLTASDYRAFPAFAILSNAMLTWAGYDRFMNIFLSTWALCAAGMVFALPMVYYRVQDHTEESEEG